MTCPWRKLEADGRILRCTGHGSICEPGFPDHVSGGYVGGVHTEDWAGPQVIWDDADPLAWDATCGDCDDGLRSEHDDLTGYREWECPTCDGAGTVDTIPDRLIGVGSVLHGTLPYIDLEGDFIVIDIDREDDEYVIAGPYDAESVPLGDLGGSWTLVRAVPPAAD